MRKYVITSIFILASGCIYAQNVPTEATPAQAPGQSPVYQVTVVSRTVQAINYGTNSEPTKVDFKGTVLMPKARGEAVVRSRQGVAEIKAKFERVAPPTRFGRQYLTYVLWAITPDGRAQNLGEVVLNGANKSKIDVTTHMQAFALIMTAEPYFSVSRPSDAVVMENEARPDTTGSIEPVVAKDELLPRQPFVYDEGVQVPPEPKVSEDEYKAMLALYEAQNSIQLAKAAGAAQFAPDVVQKAEQLYRQALDQKTQHAGMKAVVASAREAAQYGADAKAVSLQKQNQQGEVHQTGVQ